MILFNCLLQLVILIIFSISIYGFGLIFNNYIFKHKSNIGEIGLYGFILIYFIVFIIHFFLPINIFINYFLLTIGLLCFFKIKNNLFNTILINKKYLLIFILFYLSSLTVNLHDDVRLYQLPYINLVQQHKIIFGLVNINDFYVYSHGLYDIMAIFRIPFYENRFIFLIPIIFLIYFIFSIFNYFQNVDEKKIIITYIFLIFSLFLIKFYRSKEFGTDLPVIALIFLSQIYFLKLFNKFNNALFGKLIIFSLFAFFLKIYSFLIIIFIIFFMTEIKKIYLFFKKNYILSFFIFIFTIISFAKTFIVSGCFIYPEPKTCVSTTYYKWSYGKELTEYRKNFLTAGSKGWRQYLRLNDYNDLISPEDYLKKNRIKYLYYVSKDNDIERIILPIVLSILFFSIFFIFYKKKENFETVPFVLIIPSTIIFILWLFLFPVSKYGGYAYVYFFSFLFCYWQFNSFKLSQKFLNYTLILLIIFFNYKSLNRIHEEITLIDKHKLDPNFNNSDFPIPIFKKIDFTPNKINKIHVNISSDEFECSNIKPICIPTFSKDLISFDKKFGYLFVYGEKDKIYKYQQRWTDKTHFLID